MAKYQGLIDGVYPIGGIRARARILERRPLPGGMADIALGPCAFSGARLRVMRQTEQRGRDLAQCGHIVVCVRG